MATITSPARSKHQQIVLWMRTQIESGAWAPHEQLKSEPELAAELLVARGTVQKAISELVMQRRLYRVRGKGTFVSEQVVESALAQSLLSLSEALDLQGVAVLTNVLACTPLRKAPLWVRSALQPTAGELVLHLRRVKEVMDGPFAVLDNYVNLAQFPGIQRINFAERRLFDVIEHDYGFRIDWGSRVFDIAEADDELARHLAVAVGTPLMRLQQATYTMGNAPIECSYVWIRSDRVRVRSVIQRDRGEL